VALVRNANLKCMCEMCCTWLAENRGCKKLPKIRQLCTIVQLCPTISSQLKHVLTIGKKLLTINISSTCPHNTVNVRLLMDEICWRVWGTPANFSGIRTSASLLHRRRSTKVNKTLQDVWPSPVLVHYIYILGASCPSPLTEFCQLQN